jgi:hypothetical protein
MFFGLNDVAFLGSLQPPVFLLDFYPNAAAAYSLRQLRTGVTNVVRVRRSSDNTEADFTAAQVSDGSLAAWVGAGNNGFVRTWYDQSGNGRNLQETVTGSQLSIVTSGTLESDGGLPAIRSISGLKTLSVLWGIAPVNPVLFLVHKITTAYDFGLSGHWVDIGSNVLLSNHFANELYNDYFNSARPKYGGTNVPRLNTRYLERFKYEAGTGTITLNNSTLGSNTFSLATPATLSVGGLSATYPATGFIQELIIYSTGTGVNATGAQSNINAHYAIY